MKVHKGVTLRREEEYKGMEGERPRGLPPHRVSQWAFKDPWTQGEGPGAREKLISAPFRFPG